MYFFSVSLKKKKELVNQQTVQIYFVASLSTNLMFSFHFNGRYVMVITFSVINDQIDIFLNDSGQVNHQNKPRISILMLVLNLNYTFLISKRACSISKLMTSNKITSILTTCIRSGKLGQIGSYC